MSRGDLPNGLRTRPILNADGTVPTLRRRLRVRLAPCAELLGSPCWLVLTVNGNLSTSPASYATVATEDGRTILAHRYMWVARHRREVPAGLVVHHRCFESRCVNPDHLATCTFGRNSQLNSFEQRTVVLEAAA